MKYNDELGIEILRHLERRSPDEMGDELHLDGFSDEEVSYHIKKLSEQRFVDGADDSTMGKFRWVAKDITAKGHKFLEGLDESRESAEEQPRSSSDPKKVFVVHGRNTDIRNSMFQFLRSIKLLPIEWSDAVSLTGKATPFTFEVLQAGFRVAQAVVILFTPDDEARLRRDFLLEHDPAFERDLTPQARPNVIFEAGMAMAMFPDRTVVVEIGLTRPMSDITGLNTVRLNNSVSSRQDLAQRLQTAHCPSDISGREWHTTGNFEIATVQGTGSVSSSDSAEKLLERTTHTAQSPAKLPTVWHVTTSIMPVIIQSGKVRLRTGHGSGHPNDPKAITAKFQLKPERDSVYVSAHASISIESDDPDAIDFMFDGVWLETSLINVRLRPGGFAELVLGIMRNGRLYACERSYLGEPDSFRPIFGKYARIQVELIGSRASSVVFTKEFKFDIDLSPEFSVRLVDGEKDLALPSVHPPNQMWKHAPDLGSQQILMLKSLYETDEYAFLESDARFERVLSRMRQKDFDGYINFLIRLLQRAENYYASSQPNADVRVVRAAITASDDDASEEILRNSGLI